MKPRARKVLLVGLACLVVLAVAVLLWLPWNPFEADAGPLDQWVPGDAEAVVRFDAGEFRRSGVLRTLWDGPAGESLRRSGALDDVLEGLKSANRELAELPGLGGDSPTIEGDLLAGEVLVALRGEDALVLSRISDRAKAVELLRRADERVLAESGLQVEPHFFRLRRRGAREVLFARRRDVLLVSTSESFLSGALSLSEGLGAPLAAASRPPAPTGARVFAWATGEFVRRHTGDPPLLAAAARTARSAPVRVEVDATLRDEVAVTVRCAAPEGLPDVGPAATAAERFADVEETIAVGALPLSASEAVSLLFDSQPPARRELLADLLAERGTTTKRVVEDLARHFEDGVGFAISRPREVEEYRLDDAQGDTRYPIPVTSVVLRLRPGAADGLVADLRRQSEALFGENAQLAEEAGPGGARVFRPREPAPFGPEWALLKPAFAIEGDRVWFSSLDSRLLAALARPLPAVAPESSVGLLRMDADRFRARLWDLRYEVADRTTYHDWARERSTVRADVARRGRSLTPERRQAQEDEEVLARIARRNQTEFPEAIRRYGDSLRWLEAFRGADVRCIRLGSGLSVEVKIAVRVP